MASNPLAQLSKLGQSPWYDQMTRSLVSQGTLKKMIEEDGLRGLTSNPTIFEKAISGSKDYEDALRELVGEGAGLAEIYDALVVERHRQRSRRLSVPSMRARRAKTDS